MTILTKEEVKEFIEKRYPGEKILAVDLFEPADMAYVLTMYNTSVVSRYVVDINSDGDIDIWSHEYARFDEVYRREEI